MRFKSTVLIIAAIMFSTVLASACTEAPAAPSSSGSTTKTPGAASTSTKPYGSLIVSLDFGSDNLDPQLGGNASFKQLSAAIFDSLTYYSAEDSQLKPGIAEKWEIAPNGLSQTFYIRKGVKFHDGSDLTGADVKFSIERQLAPESTGTSDVPLWRATVAGVDLKDDHTVVIRMKQPQYELMKGYDQNMLSVVPKKYIEEKGVDYFRKNPVGSGPWKFVKYEPGNRLELEAVENHWRTVPKFKSVTLLAVKEEATKIAMIKTGELDLSSITPDSVANLKAAGVRVNSFESGAQYFAYVFYDPENADKYAFGDVRVRKALQLSINAKELADKVLSGYGRPYALYYAGPAAYFWDPNQLKPDPFDPEGAKKLLAEAGYAGGVNTKLWDTGGAIPGLRTINQALEGYFRKVGVNSDVVTIEYTALRPKFVPKVTTEMWPSIWPYRATEQPNFEGMTTPYHSTKGIARNIKNARLDELIDKVPQTADPAEKKKLALEAAVLAKNEYNALQIVAQDTILAVGAKIGKVSAARQYDLGALALETITHAQ